MTRRASLLIALALVLSGCGGEPPAVANQRFADAFLAANAKNPAVTVLPSGLQYRVIRAGPASGVSPQAHDHVLVQYEGRLADGRIFDSSYAHGAPAAFGVSGLIPGWTEALQKMKPGDEWMLFVPPLLATTGPRPPARSRPTACWCSRSSCSPSCRRTSPRAPVRAPRERPPPPCRLRAMVPLPRFAREGKSTDLISAPAKRGRGTTRSVVEGALGR